ncbi:Bug family tripartite tricarboxylate transporter substrate binding protein [Roseomonas populi]|uniref:Tripartite tricarboxylate transporter substrate binding protein n=1 Tax=Roseomonas populi TaxID=3121582 RepID=A0ABT1X3V0_9PROT|nr:tripartite tricarboxylate transporter substrate binding protein [Roseomonas pecuniae]MCR0982784.1 tripartite tricarboxylate transporter substrate binding protein [Roseomonas pecuniae]
MRNMLRGLAAALFLAATSGLAHAQSQGQGQGQAQSWPDRPITLVHGFGAGGNADVIARIVAQPLSEALGKPVVVEARTGAGGNIASEYVARTTPDGHTLILLTGGHAVSAAMYRGLRFDPVEDFAFVSLVSVFPFVVATRAEGPVGSMAELIAAARRDPGGLTFSSVGVGSTQHLTGELLAQMAGIRLTHVPYRGGTQPLTDLLSGRIDLMVDSVTVTGAAIAAGKVRALGVTSAAPWPALPGAPTVSAAVPEFEVVSWVGLAAPARTPEHVVERLNRELRAVLAQPAVRERLEGVGTRVNATSPDEMRRFISGEVKRWNEVVTRAGIERQ